MKSYLENKLENINEDVFLDLIIYGTNCFKFTKEGKIKNFVIFLDPEEKTYLTMININEDKKEILKIPSINDIIINNKLDTSISKVFFEKNTTKKLITELNIKCHLSIKTNLEEFELLFDDISKMDYFLK